MVDGLVFDMFDLWMGRWSVSSLLFLLLLFVCVYCCFGVVLLFIMFHV